MEVLCDDLPELMSAVLTSLSLSLLYTANDAFVASRQNLGPAEIYENERSVKILMKVMNSLLMSAMAVVPCYMPEVYQFPCFRLTQQSSVLSAEPRHSSHVQCIRDAHASSVTLHLERLDVFIEFSI